MAIEFDPNAKVQYVCSLSKLVRLGVRLTNSQDGLKRQIEALVQRFENDPGLKASLKQKPEPGTQILRQVDLRKTPDDPDIMFKCFVNWDWRFNMWHVYVEGPQEQAFENGEPNF